jgi:hypothetical protein
MPRLRSIALAAILFALASASTAGLAQGQALKSYNAAIGDSSSYSGAGGQGCDVDCSDGIYGRRGSGHGWPRRQPQPAER